MCLFPIYSICLFIDNFFVFSSVKNETKVRIADFVHGNDGLGNQNFPPPKGKPIEKSGPEFLVEQAKLYPGEVTVVALGPLTNIALVRVFLIRIFHFLGLIYLFSYYLYEYFITMMQAVQLDPDFSKNVGQIVLLGGAFAVNGNVNPASEANVSFFTR